MFVQNLNPSQQEILLKLADDLMLSDGVKDQREEDLLRIIKSQCNADISSKKEFELSGLANLFVSKKAKVSLLLELIGLAHADGDYGKEEMAFINEIALLLNINSSDLSQLESWVISLLDLMKVSVKLMEE